MGIRESRISSSPAVDPQQLLCLWESLWEESRPGRPVATAMPDYAAGGSSQRLLIQTAGSLIDKSPLAAARAAAAAAMNASGGSLQPMPEAQLFDIASPPSALFVQDQRTGHYIPTRKHQSVLSRHSSSSSGSFSRSWQRLLAAAPPSQPSRVSTLADSMDSPDPVPPVLSTSPVAFAAPLAETFASSITPTPSYSPAQPRTAASSSTSISTSTSSQPAPPPPQPAHAPAPQPRRPASQLTQALRSPTPTPSTSSSSSATTTAPSAPVSIPPHTPAGPSAPIGIPIPSPRTSGTGQSKHTSSRPMAVPTPDPRRRSLHRTSSSRPSSPTAAPAPLPSTRRPPAPAQPLPSKPSIELDDCDLDSIEEYQEPVGTGRAFGTGQQRRSAAPRNHRAAAQAGTGGGQLRMAFISEGTRQPLLAEGNNERRLPGLALPPAGEEDEEEKARGGRWRSATACGDLTVRGAGLYAEFMQQQQQPQQEAVLGRYAPKGRPAFRSEPIQAAIMASPQDTLQPSRSPTPPTLTSPFQPASAHPFSTHPTPAAAAAAGPIHPPPPPPRAASPPHALTPAPAPAEPENPLPDYVQRILASGASGLQSPGSVGGIPLPRKLSQQARPPRAASPPTLVPTLQPATQLPYAPAAVPVLQPAAQPQLLQPPALLQPATDNKPRSLLQPAAHQPAGTPPAGSAASPPARKPRNRAARDARAAVQAASGHSHAAAAAASEQAAQASASAAKAVQEGQQPQPQAAASVAPIEIRSRRAAIKKRSKSLLPEAAAPSPVAPAAGLASAVRQGSCGDLVQMALSGRGSQSWGQQFLVGSSNKSPVLV